MRRNFIKSEELLGLQVKLDQLIYENNPEAQGNYAHAFIYFITIRNLSDRKITLLGRKWVIENADLTKIIIEGEKIVGKTPTLASGEIFSYNSYHVANQNARAFGSFHGIDEFKNNIHANLKPFEMNIPK
jgi:ApaG protein